MIGRRGASWPELSSQLRPFISRRIRAAADVDDVLQETLLRLHRGLGSLRDDERFGAWVYRIARSAIVDHLRTRARHPLASDEGVEPMTEEEEDQAAVRCMSEAVRLFVPLLPEPYREAITLVELEGLTHAEAAERLGISLSGMKSRVQRGRAKLRSMLEACCAIALDPRGRIMDYEPRDVRPEDCCPSSTLTTIGRRNIVETR